MMKKAKYLSIEVVICTDEKTARDLSGNVWEISGLLVEKPENVEDVIYPLGSEMCNAITYKGQTNHALVAGDKILLT